MVIKIAKINAVPVLATEICLVVQNYTSFRAQS